MIKIVVRPLRCYVSGENLFRASSYIDAATSYLSPGHQFTHAFRRHAWDGKRHLYGRGSFPTGLLPDVLNALSNNGFKIEIENQLPTDGRPLSAAKIVPDFVEGITLRDYQLEAVRAAVDPKRLPPYRGIIWFPARSGKTDIASAVVKAFRLPSTLFVTHQRTLLHQTKERFEARLGVPVGIIGDTESDIKPITVAMVQTLVKRLDQYRQALAQFQLAIFDEVHHLRSTSWYTVARVIQAPYRFGLSATPDIKGPGMLLVAQTGPIIAHRSIRDLVDEGHLARPLVKMIPVDHPVMTPKSRYQTVYRECIVNNVDRNTRIAQEVVAYATRGKRILVLVTRIPHMRALLQAIRHLDPYVSVEQLYQATSSKERTWAMKDLDEDKLSVIVATPIFDEGVDLPNLDVVVIAGGQRSEIKTIQRSGRGLTQPGSKKAVLIIDFYDKTHRFMKAHSDARYSIYLRERYVFTRDSFLPLRDRGA